MKAIFTRSLLALLGLAMAACSSSRQTSSVEYDDVYHSRADRTAVTQSGSAYASPDAYADPASGTATDNGALNPEYSGSANTGGTSVTNNYYSGTDDYYRVSNNPVRYNSFVGYNAYDPYQSNFFYARPVYYGMGAYPAYYYANPYVDPFWYTPYPAFYRPGVTISIGFGFGSGFYGNPYYPAFYDPWYSPFYSPYYSPYAGFHGYNYGYWNGYNHGYHDGLYSSHFHRPVHYGKRGDNSSGLGGGRGNTGGGGRDGGRRGTPDVAGGSNSGIIPAGGGRRSEAAVPVTNQPAGTAPARPRTATPAEQPRAIEQPARGNAQPVGEPMTMPSRNNQAVEAQPRPRTQPVEAQPGYQPAPRPRGNATPEYAPAPNPRNTPAVEPARPQTQPEYQPAPRPRRESQPSMQAPSRGNAQPAPGMEKSRPTRSFDGGSRQPSYSSPSRSVDRPSAPSGGSFERGGGGGGGGSISRPRN